MVDMSVLSHLAPSLACVVEAKIIHGLGK